MSLIFPLIAVNGIYGINGSSEYLILSTKILVILKMFNTLCNS